VGKLGQPKRIFIRREITGSLISDFKGGQARKEEKLVKEGLEPKVRNGRGFGLVLGPGANVEKRLAEESLLEG